MKQKIVVCRFRAFAGLQCGKAHIIILMRGTIIPMGLLKDILTCYYQGHIQAARSLAPPDGFSGLC
jgi:hypothetical protein